MFLKNIKKDQIKNSLVSWRFNVLEAREGVDKSLTKWPLHKQLHEKVYSLKNLRFGLWEKPKALFATDIYNEILKKNGKKDAKKYIADLNNELKMAKKPYRYFLRTGFIYIGVEQRKTKVTHIDAKKTIKARAFPYFYGFLQASTGIKKLAQDLLNFVRRY